MGWLWVWCGCFRRGDEGGLGEIFMKTLGYKRKILFISLFQLRVWFRCFRRGSEVGLKEIFMKTLG